jgi:hypothetical protein
MRNAFDAGSIHYERKLTLEIEALMNIVRRTFSEEPLIKIHINISQKS